MLRTLLFVAQENLHHQLYCLFPANGLFGGRGGYWRTMGGALNRLLYQRDVFEASTTCNSLVAARAAERRRRIRRRAVSLRLGAVAPGAGYSDEELAKFVLDDRFLEDLPTPHKDAFAASADAAAYQDAAAERVLALDQLCDLEQRELEERAAHGRTAPTAQLVNVGADIADEAAAAAQAEAATAAATAAEEEGGIHAAAHEAATELAVALDNAERHQARLEALEAANVRAGEREQLVGAAGAAGAASGNDDTDIEDAEAELAQLYAGIVTAGAVAAAGARPLEEEEGEEDGVGDGEAEDEAEDEVDAEDEEGGDGEVGAAGTEDRAEAPPARAAAGGGEVEGATRSEEQTPMPMQNMRVKAAWFGQGGGAATGGGGTTTGGGAAADGAETAAADGTVGAHHRSFVLKTYAKNTVLKLAVSKHPKDKTPGFVIIDLSSIAGWAAGEDGKDGAPSGYRHLTLYLHRPPVFTKKSRGFKGEKVDAFTGLAPASMESPEMHAFVQTDDLRVQWLCAGGPKALQSYYGAFAFTHGRPKDAAGNDITWTTYGGAEMTAVGVDVEMRWMGEKARLYRSLSATEQNSVDRDLVDIYTRAFDFLLGVWRLHRDFLASPNHDTVGAAQLKNGHGSGALFAIAYSQRVLRLLVECHGAALRRLGDNLLPALHFKRAPRRLVKWCASCGKYCVVLFSGHTVDSDGQRHLACGVHGGHAVAPPPPAAAATPTPGAPTPAAAPVTAPAAAPAAPAAADYQGISTTAAAAIRYGVMRAVPRGAWRLVADFASQELNGAEGVPPDADTCAEYMQHLRGVRNRNEDEESAVAHRWPNDQLAKTRPPLPILGSKLDCEAWTADDGSYLLRLWAKGSTSRSLAFVPKASVQVLAAASPSAQPLDAVFAAVAAGLQWNRQRVEGLLLQDASGAALAVDFDLNTRQANVGNWVRDLEAARRAAEE